MSFTVCDQVFTSKQLLLQELKDFFHETDIDKYNSDTFSNYEFKYSYKEIVVNSNYFKINPDISMKCSKNKYTDDIYNLIFSFLKN